MRRDLDMMRDLMLEIESRAHGDPLIRVINLTPDELQSQEALLGTIPFGGKLDESELALADPERYHQARLLYEAGFIEEDAYYASRRGSFTHEFHIERLTNDGHDFLDSIRNDGVFTTVKEKMATVGGAASLAIVKALAEGVTKDLLKL